MTMNNNANWGFLGDHNLTFSNAVLGSSANSNILINSIVAGKALTFTGLVANALTATRNFTVDGPGETIINGNFTTSTAFGVQIIKTGDGTLTLGGDGTVSNWNQVGAGMDLDRGSLKFITNNAINTTAAYAGITLSPELTESDTATIDLNGTSQTINAFTAAAAATGAVIIDNTAATAATFTLGANNSTVSITNTGARTITDSGAGALSIVKTGNTAAVLPTGMTLTYQGSTSSTGGGSFTINSVLNGTSGLIATGNSTLALPGGLTAPGAITSIEVSGGSTLSLLDGAGSAISNLTNLSLGAGSGTTTLNLNVGDLSAPGDFLNTDTLTLLTGGTLNLANTVTFNLTDAGLNPSTTYTLLNLVDGGITAFGAGNMIQGAMPGGFSGFTWTVNNNLVQLTTGTLITGSSYWRGLTDNTWNANADNWSTDKAGSIPAASIPGSGTDVVFAYDGLAAAPLTTTLEQNIKINSLTFEVGTTTPTAVTIDPGAVSTNRLEVAPQVATDGIKITAGGPPTVTISAPLRLGANQTWNVADAASVLTLSGGLQGEKDVTQTGSGKVIVSIAADNAFNSGNTADFTVDGGNLEIQSIDALGVTGKRANVAVNTGGAFYYNNATAGTVTNALTLGGGTLSAGGANQTYSGTVNVSSDSIINMRNNNAGTGETQERSITLSGVVSGSGNLTVSSDLTLSSGNAISGNLTLSNAANTWSGDLFVNQGTVTFGALTSPGIVANDITFNSLGKVAFQGVNSTTLTRSGTLNFAAGSIGEFNVDNTSGALGANYLVDQNGAITLGAGGTGATVRLFLADAASAITLSGAVTLGGNSSISVAGGDADSLLNISSVISDGGSGYALAINDDAGGWAQTNTIVRLMGANTFSGNFALGQGVAEFDTVTGISGAASSLGQGTAITIDGGNLRFIGSTSQTTDRPISTTASSTLSANGTGGAKITYTGAITQALNNSLTLSGAAGSEGEITAGITQATGAASDLAVNGGTWTLSGAASTISDDVAVSGTTTILNLNTAGVLAFGSSTGNLLQITNGGTVNLGATGTMTGFADTGVYIAQSAGGAEAVLNMNSFDQTFLRLILGERLADRSGRVDGTGTLTIDGATGIELYSGTISANLASTAATPFNKYGPGIIALKGDNSGIATTTAAIINEGTLVLDYTASNTTKLRAASQLDMRGSNLTLIGNDGAATAQTVASFTLGSGGNSVITITPGVGQEAVLNLNAITRAINAQDGTVRFVLPVGTQSATNGITTDTLNTIGTAPNAILGAWATVNDGTGTFFARNATNAVDGNIVAAATTLQDAIGSWLTGENISDSAGFTGTVDKSYINSLRFNAVAGSDISLATTGVLGINSGGILVTDVVGGTPSLSSGTLFSGTVVATPELVITQIARRSLRSTQTYASII
jgi:fibronectin-binding autotransporter adhesin